jgi:cell division protein FtsI/penicillin-binding protein 2
VILTLDQRLQQKAYELLAGRKGAVVIMRPRSGLCSRWSARRVSIR